MVPGTMPQVMMQGQPGMMPQQAMAASASGPPGSQTAPMMVPMAVPGHPTFVYTGGVPTGQMVMMPMSAPPPAAPAAAASQAPAQGGAEQGAQSN